MEDFLWKLLVGVFTWIVALFVVELIAETIKVEIVPATFSNDANLIGAFMTYVKLKDTIK